MAKPKVRGHRRGGRNRQFFESLSGLAGAIDKTIKDNKMVVQAEPVDKRADAEAKRKRKAYARLKQAGLIKETPRG